jgi:hypothetical protein
MEADGEVRILVLETGMHPKPGLPGEHGRMCSGLAGRGETVLISLARLALFLDAHRLLNE